MTPIELGRLAYETYAKARGGVAFTGEPLPRFDDQNLALRDAWITAAQAVAQRVRNLG